MKKILLTVSFVILTLLVLSCNAAPSLKVKVLGIKGELLDSVNTQIQLKQEAITEYNTKTISDFYLEVPQEIAKALEPHGYFKATVVGGLSAHKKDKWEGVFRVNLGSPVKIVAIDLKLLGVGATDTKILKHMPEFPLKTGKIFRVDKYNDAKQFLFDLAGTYGYITAFLVEKEVRIDLENNAASIVLHFDTGPRYYFGATTFTVPYFSKEFLAKFLPYKSGEVYSSKKIYALQEALSNSNFFKTVDVNPQITEDQSLQVPVDITLTPFKAKQYNLGLGYGTDTGVRGSLGLESRYLTPSGRSFKGMVRGSQVQNDLELHYLIPGRYPPTDVYDLSLAGQTLYLDKGKSLTGQAGIGYITVLKKWRQTIRLSLQHEHYQLVDQPYESSTLLIPSINWFRTKSDDPIKPTTGYRVNINLQGAKKHWIASSSFLQTQADFKYMKTFYKRMQLILRGTLGYTAINDLDDLPLSLQFYTGGAQSIRGYGYNSIGPGRNLAVGSIELRHKVVKDWYLTAFFDAGNASNDLFAKPNRGVGGGIVFRTGIGTLELTYAKAISQSGSPGRIQFSLGTEL